MQEILGIPIGSFPIRYLGVPLTYKKLTIQQCKPLVERVTSKMRGWATKCLSYAGRLQLIKGVLFGMQTYWAPICVLPKKILKEIEMHCRVFLWTGKAQSSRKALVAWDPICLPKVCGGWNVVKLADWNKTAIAKLLRDIAKKADNLSPMITSHASFLTSNPRVEKHHDAEFSLLDPIGNELAKNIVTRIPTISSIICTARELSTPSFRFHRL